MNNRQVSRWVFTFNNYDSQLNIRQYLSTQSSIKRAIWGFETSAVGTKHLQGYIEFHRSVRFTFVMKIFPRAFWDPARGSSRQNFNYCSKGGHFDFIGDFSREQSGKTAATTKNIPMPVPLILRGLLNPVTAAQTKVSKEFSDKFNYYNYAVPFLTDIKERNELYDQWQNKLLYLWQFTVLRKLMGQNDREILWICDPEGNNGKSFLAHYLHALYDFTILDGVLSCKDLAHVLKGKPKGAAFDLARSNIRFVDYSVFESLKNGFLLSGKYKGKSMRFQPLRILVLANECPQKSQLSQDRWCVWTVGEGELSDMGKHAVVSPGEQFPFVRPEKYPNLEEDFDLRLFYSENGIKSSSDRTTNPTSTR